MEPNWIAQRAYLTPNRIGLSYLQQQWTYAELHTIANRITQQLASFQITAGDRVAIIGPSSPLLVQVIYGCMNAQIEMVFLNNRLTQEELNYQVHDAEVAAIIYDACEETRIASYQRKVSFQQLVEAPQQNVNLAAEWDPNFTTSIMYTSGTTGYPKGVRQTLANHKASALSSALNLGVSPTDVWLCAVPIFHISGFSMLMKSILYGVTLRLYPKFDLEKSVEEIVQGSVTHMSVVGVTLGQIVHYMEERKWHAHSNFQLMLAGGGPIAVDYLKRAKALQLNVAQTYGMTETASQTATLSSEEALQKIGSAGKPLFFNEIRIDGSTGPLSEGEILIKGPHVTPGYIGRFQDVAAQHDGWLKSGDIGYLDEEGYLYIVDRRSDLIISGGENIYPAEIENVLLSHPLIVEAGVCGVEDAHWGQVPAAFIIAKEPIEEEALIAFCKGRLASYKVPKHVYFVEQLPRTGSNKLMRRKLHELR